MRLTAWGLELRFGAPTNKSTAKQTLFCLIDDAKLRKINNGYQQINANNHYEEVALSLRGSA